jgi:hypothetical protein
MTRPHFSIQSKVQNQQDVIFIRVSSKKLGLDARLVRVSILKSFEKILSINKLKKSF